MPSALQRRHRQGAAFAAGRHVNSIRAKTKLSGQPAARVGDMTAHGGVIVAGLPTVLIGIDSGGGAGAGATGSAAGAAMAVPIMAEGKDTLAGAMAMVMIEAAKEGKPFCEQCTRAALAAQGYK